MTGTTDFRKDLRAAHLCVAEMLRLAKALPDGLDRLRRFTAGRDFWDWEERAEGGAVILAPVPNARTRAFLQDLRLALGRRAA